VRRIHPLGDSAWIPPWDPTAGNGSAWNQVRYYGSHFRLPSPVPGVSNWIVRTGGHQGVAPFGLPTESVEICDAGSLTGNSWTLWSGRQLNEPRTEHNTVLLPDGTVLAVGGRRQNVSSYSCTSIRSQDGPSVLTPEILSGSGWTPVASHISPRVYHSSALLLPDGRVLVAGGECRTWDYEIYRPPYLTNGRPRPEIVQVGQETMGYDVESWVSWISIPDPLVSVDKVVLMRPGAVTHHTDMDQRYIELSSDLDLTSDPPRRFFKTPLNTAHAPRGWYMLFVVTNERVPSEAAWVRLE